VTNDNTPTGAQDRFCELVRDLIAGNSVLEAAISPLLQAQDAMAKEFTKLDKLVRDRSPNDDVCRRLFDHSRRWCRGGDDVPSGYRRPENPSNYACCVAPPFSSGSERHVQPDTDFTRFSYLDGTGGTRRQCSAVVEDVIYIGEVFNSCLRTIAQPHVREHIAVDTCHWFIGIAAVVPINIAGVTLKSVRRQSFSESVSVFTTEALVRFLFEFRRRRLGAATGVFGLSVS